MQFFLLLFFFYCNILWPKSSTDLLLKISSLDVCSLCCSSLLPYSSPRPYHDSSFCHCFLKFHVCSGMGFLWFVHSGLLSLLSYSILCC